MLEIRFIMDSPVEEVLGFKTCCGLKAFDQNLEILVRNIGFTSVRVRGYFDLRGVYGEYRMNAVIPPEGFSIEPGDVRALYCYMDETLWKKSTRLILYDSDDNEYQTDIHQK